MGRCIDRRRDENKLAMREWSNHRLSREPMPTYDYVCEKCGHELEVFQSMKDDRLTKCPQCKKQGLKRLLGAGAGLIFKGTGFYITDYKTKKGTPDAAPSESSAPSKESAKPSKETPATKSVSKPAANAADK